MKTLIIALALVSSAFAQTFTWDGAAVVRNSRHKAKTREVTLVDLTSQDSFEGLYFKIVKGKDEKAIRFDDEAYLVFKATTVYHHLTKARDYFVNHLGSAYVKSLPQITVRLEHFNNFSELGHYKHDNVDPQYNNALTIPSGKGMAGKPVKPWGIEIWFRPVKEIHISEIQVHQDSSAQTKTMLQPVRKQLYMQNFSTFLSQLFVGVGRNGSQFNINSVMRTFSASLIVEAMYQFSDPIEKIFRRRWYHLDTALVPEIIHHEFSHVALSDHLELSRSTAVIEGMADFFAGEIGSTKKLAKKIKKYNSYAGKKAKDDKEFQLIYEHPDYANTDFMFGVLVQLKDLIGGQAGTRFVYDLREKITTDSSIRNELIEGILKQCDQSCASPKVDKLRILKAFNDRKI